MKDQDTESDLPSIRATDDERPVHGRSRPDEQSRDALTGVRAPQRQEPPRQANGALWALCGALCIGLIGFGYWSHQQQSRLQQQLVATQNSFARISEEAAGRLQDISGKVTATESTLGETEQARLAQLQALEKRLAELAAQIQSQGETLDGLRKSNQALEQGRSEQQQRLAALAAGEATLNERLDGLTGNSETLGQQLEATGEQVASLRGQLDKLSTIEQQLAAQAEQLKAQQQSLDNLNSRAAQVNVEQEMLVLRSELDERLANSEQELRAINSFRVQTNRSISTLQSQLATLQQRIGQP